PCRPVEGVWSLPGELIDPANVDYEAAAKYFCEVAHPEFVEKPCEGHLEWVVDLVGLALGIGDEVGRDAGRKASLTDILAAVRTLPGVEEVCECGVLKSKHRKSVMPHYKAASLVVPLSEEE